MSENEKLSCMIVGKMLSDYMDGRFESDPDFRRKLEHHISSCTGCRTALEELKRDMAFFSLPANPEPAPAEFRSNFLARLHKKIDAEQTRRNAWLRRTWAVSAVAAAIVIALGIWLWPSAPDTPRNPIPESHTLTATVRPYIKPLASWGGHSEKIALTIREQAIIDEVKSEIVKTRVETEVVTENPIKGSQPLNELPQSTAAAMPELMCSSADPWLTIDETEMVNSSRMLENDLKMLHQVNDNQSNDN